MATEATHLHSLKPTSPLEQSLQSGGHWQGVVGHSEVWPVEMIVAPRRFPLRIQIKTVVRWLVSGIGVPGVKRNGGHLGPIRQYDDGTVEVPDELPMIVVGISALG